jgi:filamentous hemagglutinin family protein
MQRTFMTTRTRTTTKTPLRLQGAHKPFMLAPIAQAIAVLIATGGGISAAHAAPAFSAGWFAAKGAAQSQARSSGLTASGGLAGIPTAAQQQQQSQQQLQQSINNVNRTAAAIAAQQAAQAAARLAVAGTGSDIPDGLADGGLKVDTNALTKGWTNANAPTQTTTGGHTTVAIQQTADKAILNWETFNVGKNTTVAFQQQADWAVLNRVNDPQARPSSILGQLTGAGTVMILNRNGIIFTGTSQVNVRNLVAAAAAMTDDQFIKNGIYGAAANAALQPSFTDADGNVLVQAGAQLNTVVPKSVTDGGGYVLLLGSEVHNDGQITTPRGQVAMAAGDDFFIRKGVATDTNKYSTTRGNEVVAQFAEDSTAGLVQNTGLLQSPEGDITLTGRTVRQDGVALSTTSVNNRGTIHLSTSASDDQGSVAFGANGVTAILIDENGGTALDSQRASLIQDSAEQDQARRLAPADIFDNLSRQDDRRDLSRIEVVSGGDIDFESGSLTVATGGQVAATATRRSTLADGAQVDVAGAVGVQVAMESNNVKINIQGNEQRDAPLNRDTKDLNNSDIWVDRRSLIYVAPGVGGYATARWYTEGGLLEVGGYLDVTGHTIGEWTAQGGTVAFSGGELVTQAGGAINVSGGTLDVQGGYINQSWMRGTDGRLHEISKAPADIAYTGLYKGYEDTHARWGETRYFYNPLIAPRRRYEDGYTVGRDAGALVVSTNSAVLQGDIVGDIYQGIHQDDAPGDTDDGYLQTQNAVARGSQLIIGRYLTAFNTDAKFGAVGVFHNLTPMLEHIVFGDTNGVAAANGATGTTGAPGATVIDPSVDLPEDSKGTLLLNADALNRVGLGSILASATENITVDSALGVTPGGKIALYAPTVQVNADLTARAGGIALGNVLDLVQENGIKVDNVLATPSGVTPGVTVGAGVTLDARGMWTNLQSEPYDLRYTPYADGGSVSIRTTGDVTLPAGSAIDVSSGAVLNRDGSLAGGTGGDVTLAAGYQLANSTAAPLGGTLRVDGDLRAYGVEGGGTLTIEAAQAIDLGLAPPAADGTDMLILADVAAKPVLALRGDLFKSGFAHYVVHGQDGVTLTKDTTLDVFMPVYRWDGTVQAPVSGTDPVQALQLWTPPVYQEHPESARLDQRLGADLTLQAGSMQRIDSPIVLEPGSTLSVDPGQSVSLLDNGGQITMDGRINAWGGSITVSTSGQTDNPATGGGFSRYRSIWVGEQAVLDVAARAYLAHDTQGRAYGVAPDGGTITLGPSDAFVVIRPGAVLDASGSQAAVDLSAGTNPTASSQPTLLAGAGGSITLQSSTGIYIDGDLHAFAGGPGAAGGALSVSMDSRVYSSLDYDDTNAIPEALGRMHNITLTQVKQESSLAADAAPGRPDDGLVVGDTRLGVDQVMGGGFDDLTLSTQDLFVFKGDIDLALRGSLNLKGGVYIVDADTPDARVTLRAPYVRLDGGYRRGNDNAAWQGTVDFYTPGLINKDGAYMASGVSGKSALIIDADLIDLYGSILSGTGGKQGDGPTNGGPAISGQPVDIPGFASIDLNVSGDVRLGDTADFYAGGDISIEAAQIYPMSGASAVITAGRYTPFSSVLTQVSSDKTLRIRSSGQAADVPASVFGNLQLWGGTVDQGGVVRAPLGVISINDWVQPVGAHAEGFDDGSTVVLRQGSITSVSAAGLVMPFGGTSDGLTYEGVGTLTALPGGVGDGGDLVTGISLGGKSIAVEAGALIDLSGGGDLRGAGFVSGRGGSVDVLATPLANANPVANRYSAASNQVYAILPGYASAYAPVIADKGAGDPAIGRQIQIGAGVPGLPAGTYTLLPASYALLPGAFRVEVAARPSSVPGVAAQPAVAVPNGSWQTTGVLSVANTGVRDNLPTSILVTSGDAVRKFSQYNETSYADFATQQSARFGGVRPLLPSDGKILRLDFVQVAGPDGANPAQALSFDGQVLMAGANGGTAGQVIVTGNQPLEITADVATPTDGVISLTAKDLNAMKAASLFIGGWYSYFDGTSNVSDSPRIYFRKSGSGTVTVGEGATLKAGQIFLVGADISVDKSAALDTRGFDDSVVDSQLGYLYANSLQPTGSADPAILAVANGFLDFQPALGTGRISVADDASLLTNGTVAFVAPGDLTLGKVNLGARYLTVSQNQVNIGNDEALAQADAAGVLPAGWQLTQDVLERLLRPAAGSGLPALERLALTANTINFFGSTTLDTGGSEAQLIINTPAFYGWGNADDQVRIVTDTLIWNGVLTGSGTTTSPYASAAPVATVPGGPGSGSGSLLFDVNTMIFGYDARARAQSQTTLDRVALGFADVRIDAATQVTANNKGTLSVGLTRDTSGKMQGGSLEINTPVVTGVGGSTMHYTAGGDIRVALPDGATAGKTDTVQDLGASLFFNGRNVTLDTVIALPSGKLDVQASGDIVLGANSAVDLSGRHVDFYDVSRDTWGGSLTLESEGGDITQIAGSVVDVSARSNDAGAIQAAALADGATIQWDGKLLGSGAQGYAQGAFMQQSGVLDSAGFAALNTLLGDGGFDGIRGFRIKHGDLVVGDGVHANQIQIVLDDGSLTVNGKVDASGTGPGRITLTASGDLTLAPSALLDAHATVLAVDSYGQPIDASNRAHVTLGSTKGTVSLQAGASIDMSSPDGIARGQLEIDAPRRGTNPADPSTDNDIVIQAAGPLNIRGAASIAVVGFRTYTLPDGTVINQALLDGIDGDSRNFINAAWNNNDLQGRLAGLKAYGAAYHLRPGVELDSTGSLSTDGDLDLSAYRYGPNADPAVRGSGEPGVLVLRAAGDLDINGSITDGFGLPAASADDNGWGVQLPSGTLTADLFIPTAGVTIQAFSFLPANSTLNFDITLEDPFFAAALPVVPGTILPADAQVQDAFLGPGMVATAPVYNADGSVLYRTGDVIPAGVELSNGEILGAGFNVGMNSSITLNKITVPAGTPLSFLQLDPFIANDLTLPAGAILPAGTQIAGYVGPAFAFTRPVGPDGTQGKQYALAPMLAPGMESWSMRLVAGADLGSADTRALRAASQVNGAGNIVLDDAHLIGLESNATQAGLSVVRTGTGDLELLAGGNYVQKTPFGVYTAGTAIDSALSAPFNLDRPKQDDGTVLGAQNSSYEPGLNDTRMWMPQQGGDFTLAAQGDILAYQNANSQNVGDWLWRQGGAGLDQPTAWGINFGSYGLVGIVAPSFETPGFSGVGTLGGGNVTVRAGRNIGQPGGATSGEGSQNLVVAVGSSGRVVDGQVVQTGGGTLDVTAGGQIYGGLFAGLLGDTDITAGSVGSVTPRAYGYRLRDQRPLDPYTPYSGWSSGEISFAPGDGAVQVRTLGDLAVNGVTDPGGAPLAVETGAMNAAGEKGFGETAFTLWTPATGIDLVSAGGNLTPVVQGGTLPSVLRAAALEGSIYYAPRGPATLMPSPDSALELLARGLVSADAANNPSNGSYPLFILGTSIDSIATPLNPAWRLGSTVPDSRGSGTRTVIDSNFYRDTSQGSRLGEVDGSIINFGPNTVTDHTSLGGEGTRIYALNGDIAGAQVGQILNVGDTFNGTAAQFYQSAGTVRLLAGGDIVDTKGLIVQDHPDDVSMIAAQGNILFSNFSIAGPGTLEVSAGGQFYQGNNNSLVSLGSLIPGDERLGADIVVQAGLGAGKPGVGATHFDDFIKQYLDPINQAEAGRPLADQPGKVAHTYDEELAQWLGDRFGYAGEEGADALGYFEALPAEQQRIFARQVYYAELLAGGREYNDVDGPRFGSYLRGRQAIATLFPVTDADGAPIVRSGNITMYQGSGSTNAGIRTVKGGSIQTLTPGGQTVVGVEGLAPTTDPRATPAGLITQGEGDIQMYSQGSVLLGLSRIMTTFGGGIQIWSAEGDINAGRGTKTTVVYTPPSLIYDDIGNLKLTPQVPSTGAGIATLNPIPEVPPGDVDLIAPQGTIDAGEAGIRVSGNINVAALHILNAANIQVQGKSTGMPVVAAINTSALTSASAAASTAANAAQDVMRQRQTAARNALPSLITVQVIGFGTGSMQAPVQDAPPSSASQSTSLRYDKSNRVQYVGNGRDYSPEMLARLTPEERRLLQRNP